MVRDDPTVRTVGATHGIEAGLAAELPLAAPLHGGDRQFHPTTSTTAELLPDAEGSRGLVLLDAVVDTCGVVAVTEIGKTVWFECASR
ncbi:hypothetical protein ACQEVG_17980 [Streptomyces sp. CA-135486]|uniref:hypothetical protein n=1 Tax=Streptomyces sp. CA-135486 TaxID=3240049 RepID=UPI003D8DA29B